MRFSSMIAIVGLMVFSVSCAQKKKMTDNDANKVTQAEVKGSEINSKDASQEKSKQSDQHKSDDSYTCDVNGDKRLISLDKQAKRCEVHYTKFGESSQVAWAESTPSICDDVFNKIRQNIESKGFKCLGQNEQDKQSQDTASIDK